MKNFAYVAKDTAGKTIKGTIEAESANEVLDRIHEQGWYCVSYTEALGGGFGKKGIHKFKAKEMSFCCRQLAAMMTSGLTIVKALDILYKQEEKKGPQEAWQGVYEDVNKGSTFTEALRAREGSFPDFFISMVDAGESAGTLDTTMQRLSDYYDNSNKLNNKVKGAMIYPAVLGVMVVAIVLILFTFVMPTFAGMMEEDEMPAISKALFAISDFIKDKWYILIGAIVLIVIGVIYAMKVPSVKIKWDKFKIKMPMVGPLIVTIYTGKFAESLSSLYSSGIPMVECLERSSKILGNTYVDNMFIQVVDEVKQGQSLSAAITKTEIFSGMFCSIIYVGEESGQLDEILEKTAAFYNEEADAAVGKLVGLMEPLMIIIMGIAIGLVLAGIFPMLYGGLNDVS